MTPRIRLRAPARAALGMLLLLCAAPAHSMFEDDPLLWHLRIDEAELLREDGETEAGWDVELQVGKDLRELRLISEGHRLDGVTEESELQLLYSHAVTPFGNLEIGLRSDLQPRPRRDWLALGLRWLAPWFVETEIFLFAGEHGQNALRVELEYEFLLHRKLELHPQLQLDFHEEKDLERGVDSGLSAVEAGLRLQYLVRREFSPYLGLHWEKRYGDADDFPHAEGGEEESFSWTLGFSFWW